MLKDCDGDVLPLLSSSLNGRGPRVASCVVVDEEGLCDRRVVLLDEVADEQVLVHWGHEGRPGFVVRDRQVTTLRSCCGMSEYIMMERKRSSLRSLTVFLFL